MVADEELEIILNYLEKNVKGVGFNLETKKNIFFEIIYRNHLIFEEYKEQIHKKWGSFLKENENSIIKKTYTTFLHRHFDEFFSFFIEKFFGLKPKKSLELIIKEKISKTDLLFEYNYHLSDHEQKIFENLSKSLNHNIKGLFYPTAYLYFILETLGIIIKGITDENLKISLEGAAYKSGENNVDVNFLVIVKDSRKETYEYYYKMVLYYFLKQFKEVPEKFYDPILEGKDNLYKLALKRYSKKKYREKLVDLLYHFNRKCRLLNNFCPLLDFFNYVCSRVEDSIFSKIEIIKKEYLKNFDYSTTKKNALIRIFDYLDRRSTLSSTFLANNLPSTKSQLNLFLLYKKYYFGSGLETLEVGDVLFLPKLFRKELNDFNRKGDNVVNSNAIKNINSFLDYFALLSNRRLIDLFFNKIFNKSVSEINYEFFKSFFKSLNGKIDLILKEENKILSEDPNEDEMSFDFIVHHICRMLYVLIDKIFLEKNLEDASKNFIDPRGRYISRNIALRVLELFIFQDYNFSDDLWPDFLLSLKQEEISKIFKKYNIKLSNKHFYNQIELNRLLITYNFQTFSEEVFLEQWLIKTLIIPLNQFIMKINDSISNPNNEMEIYDKLCEIFLDELSNPEENEEIKKICQNIASSFWKSIQI
ncbi:MAG: hypothetical protein ACQERB_02730 [Promethearchaeati archaeon]